MTQSSVIPFGEAPLSILRQGILQTSSSFWLCEATPPVKLARITRLVKRVAHPGVEIELPRSRCSGPWRKSISMLQLISKAPRLAV
jgi:hypothetical protein